MTRKYYMKDAVNIADQAANDIEKWLKKQNYTIEVYNVEENGYYRNIDVDLIWASTSGTFKIEIKGDRWDKTGNFFFETYSNKEKGTPGCFIYTEANYVFYYFVKTKVLYVLPMPKIRKWFLRNINRFKERATTTPLGNGEQYTTVGRLVPISDVLKDNPDVKKMDLNADSK
ncbi:MAG: hypothetical protein ACOCRO_01560 [Halanaerobiales bacterium]